jgi:hypothetical protein
MTHHAFSCVSAAGILLAGAFLTSCSRDPQAVLAAKGIAPIYNPQTGRLEQLLSDRDGDGRKETRAFMDGTTIKYIEIDRNLDGKADRWEYYVSNVIDHAEESNGPGQTITRREFFIGGVIRRVVDDVDVDGRPDKWEHYDSGTLTRVDLDLVGKGYPSQRLTYSPDGNLILMETDPDGDGKFTPMPLSRASAR